MNGKGILSLSFLLLIMSCSNKYNLEKKAGLNFNESYYTQFNSPIRGGESGVSIYLVMDKQTDTEAKNIKIEGIYFKDAYCNLKNQGANKYQGFIGVKRNLEAAVFENNTSINTKREIKKEKIPFTLKNNEAVVRYKLKDKQKYVKINLTKKQTIGFPM